MAAFNIKDKSSDELQMIIFFTNLLVMELCNSRLADQELKTYFDYMVMESRIIMFGASIPHLGALFPLH